MTKLRSSLPQGLITTFILEHQGGAALLPSISMLTPTFIMKANKHFEGRWKGSLKTNKKAI